MRSTTLRSRTRKSCPLMGPHSLADKEPCRKSSNHAVVAVPSSSMLKKREISKPARSQPLTKSCDLGTTVLTYAKSCTSKMTARPSLRLLPGKKLCCQTAYTDTRRVCRAHPRCDTPIVDARVQWMGLMDWADWPTAPNLFMKNLLTK